MAGTTKERCNCISDFQDKLYGIGMRVHNVKLDKSKGSYCTVCGHHKTSSVVVSKESDESKVKSKKK